MGSGFATRMRENFIRNLKEQKRREKREALEREKAPIYDELVEGNYGGVAKNEKTTDVDFSNSVAVNSGRISSAGNNFKVHREEEEDKLKKNLKFR